MPPVGKATVSPAARAHAEQLKRYWAFGEGAAKWVNNPKPWTTLHALLSKYVHGRTLDGLTDNIYRMVFHRQPPHGKKG